MKATITAVSELPVYVKETLRKNEGKLALCSSDLTSEEKNLMIRMFNEDWSFPFAETDTLTHICSAGCCESTAICRQKIRTCLGACFSRLFECPLLYRWKAVTPACIYTLRGLTFRKLLVYVWQATMSADFDQDFDKMPDIDDADVSPALRQKIRMGKVLDLLQSPETIAPWLIVSGCRR